MKDRKATTRPGTGKARAARPTEPPATWAQRLEDLKDFRTQHGHCRVPADYPPNRLLGRWVNYLRLRKRAGKLAPAWIAALDELGFSWVLRVRQVDRHDGDEMLAALAAFRERFGHGDVPRAWPEDPRLASWVAKLRRQQRRGQLARRRIAQLARLGLDWEPSPQLPWSAMYAALVAYQRVHGNCHVPQDWPDNPGLGTWVLRQRQARKANRLAEDRIAELDRLAFVWNWPEHQWESQYAALVEFQEAHGHCRVSTRSPAHAALANWVRTLRARKKQGKLSAERIRRLERLGFTWEISPPRPAARGEGPLTQAEAAARLTRREAEVLRQVAGGRTNRQIAATLQISDETVKEYLQHVFGKLGVTNRAQVALWAAQNGSI